MSQRRLLESLRPNACPEKIDYVKALILRPKNWPNSKQRLDIYRHAYEIRLKEAITLDFEFLKKALSVRRFEIVLNLFLKTADITNRPLNEIGFEFVDWLKSTAGRLVIMHRLKVGKSKHCQLVAIAELDLVFYSVWMSGVHAFEKHTINLNTDFSADSKPTLKIIFNPSIRSVKTAISSINHKLKNVEFSSKSTNKLIFWNQGGRVHWKFIQSSAEAAFVSVLSTLKKPSSRSMTMPVFVQKLTEYDQGKVINEDEFKIISDIVWSFQGHWFVISQN